MDKVIYIYESHTGGDNYVSEKELTDEQRYCPSCNSSDTLLYKGTVDEILKSLEKAIKSAKRALGKAQTADEQIDAECELNRATTHYQYTSSIINQYFWDRLENNK